MRRLHREGAMVITDHGQPRALLLPVDAASFLDTAVDVLAARALLNVRAQAERSGTAKLSPVDIRSLVKKTRRQVRARAA